MIGIYKFENIYNHKVYIGKSMNIEKRYKTHFNNASKGVQSYFYTALRKYKPSDFSFEVLCQCPKEYLNYWEKFYIKYYCANIPNYGYNMTIGGDGISYWDESLKKKMSKSTYKRFEDPKERDKLSISALKRFEDPKERDKVRQEQYKRLQDDSYRQILKEAGAKGCKNRWDKFNQLSSEDQIKYRNEQKQRSTDFWNNTSDEYKEYWREKCRQDQLKYWSTHPGATKGKHRVWNDETHTSFHYE